MTAIERQKEELLYLANLDLSKAEDMGRVTIGEYIRLINIKKLQPKLNSNG